MNSAPTATATADVSAAKPEPAAEPKPEPEPVSVAFVTPYFDPGEAWRALALERTLASIAAQTEAGWHLYLVDDCSPAPGTTARLEALAQAADGRVTVLRTPRNAGAGSARNAGVAAAARDGHALICFLDADDLAHPGRVAAVRAAFAADPELDFVYCDIEFIDDTGEPWRSEDLLPGLHELDRQQRLPKLRGRECWIEHALSRDCLAIPSATNVRTALALAHPFPEVAFAEDVATLFRYLGAGAKIDHVPGVPTRYRVPRVGGSSSRRQSGGVDAFNRMRCVNERAGFEDAVAMAAARGAVDEAAVRAVRARYLLRIARTVSGEGSLELGLAQLAEAYAADPDAFGRHATAEESASVSAVANA